MSAYATLTKDVFSVFGSNEWIAEGIKVVPQNYVGNTFTTEYLRVSVMPSGSGINSNSKSGLVLIDIFTPVGDGPLRAADLADKLDQFLLGKSFTTGVGVTQILKTSSLQIKGNDKGNSAFCHAIYQVQFYYFQLED